MIDKRTGREYTLNAKQRRAAASVLTPSKAKGSIMENTAFGLFVSMVRVQVLHSFFVGFHLIDQKMEVLRY